MDHLWRFLGTKCVAQRSTLWPLRILSQPSVELLSISGCDECGTLVAAIPTRQTIVCSCSLISLLMFLWMCFFFPFRLPCFTYFYIGFLFCCFLFFSHAPGFPNELLEITQFCDTCRKNHTNNWNSKSRRRL